MNKQLNCDVIVERGEAKKAWRQGRSRVTMVIVELRVTLSGASCERKCHQEMCVLWGGGQVEMMQAR